MSKASKSIALLLLPLSIIFLGYHGCDQDADGYATTRSSSSGSSFWYWGRSSYYGRSGYSSGGSSGSRSSFSSGTSRGGFGSHGSSSS
jgi:hypothetical protein